MAHRHKREANARRTPRVALVAGPLAVLVTAPAVLLGVLAADPSTTDLVAGSPLAAASLSLADLDRENVSRSGNRAARSSVRRGARAVLAAQGAFERREERERREAAARATQRATQTAIQNADTRLWTTAPLNLWSDATKQAEKIGVVESGARVLLTGRRNLGRAEIVLDGNARWVTGDYLSDAEPTPGIGGACTNGTSVSGGANVISVHQSVCAAFPEITSYGTYRSGSGDHASGRAVDIMVTGSFGWEVADFVRTNYVELGVSYVIFSQNIWSVDRGGEGWRGMSDRGSTTANHYDHVHVSTY